MSCTIVRRRARRRIAARGMAVRWKRCHCRKAASEEQTVRRGRVADNARQHPRITKAAPPAAHQRWHRRASRSWPSLVDSQAVWAKLRPSSSQDAAVPPVARCMCPFPPFATCPTVNLAVSSLFLYSLTSLFEPVVVRL